MDLFSIFGKILVDNNLANSNIEETDKKGKSLATTLGSGIGNAATATGNIIKTTGAVMLGFGAIVGSAAVGVFKLAEKASDLSEAQNVVQQTFKTCGTEINKWTETLAASAGIGKTMGTSMVGSMGAMLKSSGFAEEAAGTMSKTLVQLTGDTASFYNLPHDVMWEKIRSGVAGETEPLKQLGINMSVANLNAYALATGVEKSYKEMDQAEQTTLRYNYLLSVTADAQGDFARTSDGMANSMRIAKMQISDMALSLGTMVMPGVNGFIGLINESLKGLSETLGEAVKSGNFSEFGTQLGDSLTKIITGITDNIPKIIPVVVSAVTGIVTALITALPTVLPALLDGVLSLLDAIIDLLGTSGPALIETAVNMVVTLVLGLLKAIPKLIPVAVSLITTLVTTLTNSIPLLIPAAIEAVVAIVMALVAALPLLIPAALQLILQLVSGIITALPTLMEAMPTLIQAVVKGIVDNLPLIIEAAVQLIMMLVDFILNPENILLYYQTSFKLMTALAWGIIQAIPVLLEGIGQLTIDLLIALGKFIVDIGIWIGEEFPKIVTKIIDFFKELPQKTFDAVFGIISKFNEIRENMINWANDNLPGFIAKFATFFLELPDKIADVGGNIVSGIWNGISAKWDWLKDKVGGLFGDLVGGIKEKLGIHSPSKVFAEMGGFMSEGMAIGISEKAQLVDKQLSNLTDGIKSKATLSIGKLTADMSINARNNNAQSNDKSKSTTVTSGGVVLNIGTFINNTKENIEDLANELDFYMKKKTLGGAY